MKEQAAVVIKSHTQQPVGIAMGTSGYQVRFMPLEGQLQRSPIAGRQLNQKRPLRLEKLLVERQSMRLQALLPFTLMSVRQVHKRWNSWNRLS